MPMPATSFLGPTAPWLQDEEDETLYSQTCALAAEQLRRRLQDRIDKLMSAPGDIEVLLLEIRRQIAECAVSGHTIQASDLNDLAMDLLSIREHSRSL